MASYLEDPKIEEVIRGNLRLHYGGKGLTGSSASSVARSDKVDARCAQCRLRSCGLERKTKRSVVTVEACNECVRGLRRKNLKRTKLVPSAKLITSDALNTTMGLGVALLCRGYVGF